MSRFPVKAGCPATQHARVEASSGELPEGRYPATSPPRVATRRRASRQHFHNQLPDGGANFLDGVAKFLDGVAAAKGQEVQEMGRSGRHEFADGETRHPCPELARASRRRIASLSMARG